MGNIELKQWMNAKFPINYVRGFSLQASKLETSSGCQKRAFLTFLLACDNKYEVGLTVLLQKIGTLQKTIYYF